MNGRCLNGRRGSLPASGPTQKGRTIKAACMRNLAGESWCARAWAVVGGHAAIEPAGRDPLRLRPRFVAELLLRSLRFLSFIRSGFNR